MLSAAVWLSLPESEPRGAAPEALKGLANERAAPETLVASYTLNAELDSSRHRIKGNGSIVWTNRARVAVDSLYLHLYLNAFKNDRTVFLRSPFGNSRDDAQGREFGYIDVHWLKARELGAVDLWPERKRHSPGDPNDETDIEVPLPRAIEPGQTLTLDVSFEAQLPEVMERTGYAGSFHFAGQWFPKLARLEPDGHFAHFAFHPQAEFYADFGRYDVTLDVPRGFVVGASGKRVSETAQGNRKRVRYVAEPVHDFAWTAWEGFQEQRFEIHGVDVRVLFPAGQSKAASITRATLEFALPFLGNRLGRYPYSTLTVVHPPLGAESAGGMEYPSLITTGGAWYSPQLGLRDVQTVVTHELGHQWFYGLLASNEASFPFLDEGLTSYAEQSALDAYLGRASMFSGFGLKISGGSLFRVFAAARAEDEPIASAASAFSSFRNLGALVYSRTATLLETVERVWGRARLERALASYAARFRFGHPTPNDFLDAIGAEVAPEARKLLESALFERGRVDYLVREVQNARTQSPAGFFERDSGRERLARPSADAASQRVGRATVYRHGSLELPVEVLLIGRDGRRELSRWDGHGSFHIFEYRGELDAVVIDPEHKLLIDENLFNNAARTSNAAIPRIHERLGYFATLALSGALP